LHWVLAETKHGESDFLLPGAESRFTFTTAEFIPLVESQCEVDPTGRTLAGHFQGGTFSGFLAMKDRPYTPFL
jgi:predicted alpha/beta superfamily hydrolase